ncbi:MAG: hypothetical protein A2Y79_04455 [Deltaproteobacteria bacterium RBG_13_43_22]|nr:MAG: hypothetical protein A2Y79_04455 [Deltaproteobacteria bacterium RBG_13_43_22]
MLATLTRKARLWSNPQRPHFFDTEKWGLFFGVDNKGIVIWSSWPGVEIKLFLYQLTVLL